MSNMKRGSLKDGSRPVIPPHRSLLSVRNAMRWFYPKESLADLRNPVFWMEAVMEFIVCAFILALVVWALSTLIPAMYTPNTLHFGLFAGFFIMYLIEGYGPLCGAPINPAGCWAFFLAGRMSFVRAVIYTGAETAGAAAGAMIGYALTPDDRKPFVPLLIPGPGLSDLQGMAIEAILTFNLVVVALSCTDPARQPPCTMHSFPIAFCIAIGIMSAGTHTGGLQNPIISFGPAVIHKNFEHHWLYWVGPYLGATVGVIVYRGFTYFKNRFNRALPPEEEHIGLQLPEDGIHL